jgi:putative transposase
MEEESKPSVATAPKAKRKNPGKRKTLRVARYPFELRLKLVKAYLEEKYPMDLLVQEAGVSSNTIFAWVKRYRSLGEGGLHDAPPNRKVKRLPLPVREKIVAVKKENRSFGVRRISDLLRRFFWLRASPEAVRQTLKAAHLIEPAKAKRRKNVDKPRFFERATPNQMWQSDIFMFRLGGTNAYLIGFIDDYSRYITSLGLYRSQTGENVMEVLRRGFGEYGPPKEMLTDNGRQYTSWRGTTRFEAELKKEKIHHIKSQPHHPMTLGKIERFWATIYEEFLVRAQFASFEEARERIAKWIKYYNHKRPHQGIGSLCPADRYFEIAAEMKKTLEAGIEENILEMALRGKPQAPFYMVGRLDGQSVVLRAEKGKLRLRVEDEQTKQEQEITYNLKEEKDGQESDGIESNKGGEGGRAGGAGNDEAEGRGGVGGCDGAVPGGFIGVDGVAQTHGGVPGTEGALCALEPVAGPGLGGDAASAPAAGEPSEGRGAAAAAPADPGEAGCPAKRAPEPFGAPIPAAIEPRAGAGEGGGSSESRGAAGGVRVDR